MASKKKVYCVLDCETATFSYADEIARNAEEKKRIAIAKPLIYDFAYCLVHRDGTIIDKKQFLIAETFSVPAIFNTAYYKEKRPIYLEMLQRNETCVKPWNDVMKIFIKDIENVDAVGAFNSIFDFKKAIPITDLYISQLYSPHYYEWEKIQRKSCERIAKGEKSSPNPDFDPNNFKFRGKTYPLFDLWGLSTTYLLNNSTYKRECLNHSMLTNSGTFFKTSAESTFRYLCNKYDFIESHTALDDAIIESFILSKIAQKHGIDIGIKYFPFRDLGATDDFCMRRKKASKTECEIVYNAMAAYINAKLEEAEELSNYAISLVNRMKKLAEYAELKCNY